MSARTRLLAFTLALLVIPVATAMAQSVFSLNLLGTRTQNGDVRATALGGAVQVVDDTLGVLQRNPAMLAYSNRVTFGTAIYSTVDENKSEMFSDREGALKFTTLTIAFSPVRRLTLAIGYRANYDANGGFTTFDTTAVGQPFTNVFSRNGGMLSFPFSAAIDLGRFLKIGGYFSVENGSIEARWDKVFNRFTSLSSFSNQERTLRGNGWGGGIELRPLRRLALGATYEAQIDYDTEVRLTNTNNAANGSYKERTILPARITGSARLKLFGGLAVYAGASYRDFTKFQGLAFPQDRLAEEIVASAGVDLGNALGSLPLWLSGTYEKLPYTLPDGEEILQVAGTIGTGLKLGRGQGKIDLALQFVQTGSVETNGFETTSIRFYLGIAGAEAWRRGPGRR